MSFSREKARTFFNQRIEIQGIDESDNPFTKTGVAGLVSETMSNAHLKGGVYLGIKVNEGDKVADLQILLDHIVDILPLKSEV